MSTIPINYFTSLAPSGAVMAFAGTTAPSGWLLCNGATVSRSTYADLFSAIGTAHGVGDGSTTFVLPDYRGRFLRGVDGGADNDPDRSSRTASNAGGNTGDAVGSVQGHSYQTHTHVQSAHSHRATGNANPFGTKAGSTTLANVGAYSTLATANPGVTESETVVNQNAAASGAKSQATANETRPVNSAVNYIIKI
jgi:microcystin-dependent protein